MSTGLYGTGSRIGFPAKKSETFRSHLATFSRDFARKKITKCKNIFAKCENFVKNTSFIAATINRLKELLEFSPNFCIISQNQLKRNFAKKTKIFAFFAIERNAKMNDKIFPFRWKP